VVLKMLSLCVKHSLIFLFCLTTVRNHCWLFSLTLWQKDQWTNLTKPFWFHSSSVLRTVLKLCRKGSCYSHCPYFVVEYGVKKEKCEIQNFTNVFLGCEYFCSPQCENM
jgi:hypothetical protein